MLTLFRLLSRIPLTWMQVLGGALGWLVWALSPSYRRQFLANAQAAGLSWSDVRPAVTAAGCMVAELPWVWMRPHSSQVLSRMAWDGAEHMEAGLKAGKGVIVLSPHIGCWEIGAQALTERFGPTHGPMVALFRPPRKEWLKPVVMSSRQRPFLEAAPTSLAGVRTLIRALRAGGYTAILPDQVPPQGQGVWAPFFGRDVYTMTLLPKLAQQTGALILLTWCERLPRGQFCLHMAPLEEPSFQDPAATLEQMAAGMNRAVERMVLHAPGQYLWGYARAKQPREER